MTIFFSSYRYCRYRLFDKPVLQKVSCRFKGGCSNQGFDRDNFQRESASLEGDVESSDSKEPVYWEIQNKRGIQHNSDVVSADSKSHYQELNIANRTSSTLYGKLNSSHCPHEVNCAQSKV